MGSLRCRVGIGFGGVADETVPTSRRTRSSVRSLRWTAGVVSLLVSIISLSAQIYCHDNVSSWHQKLFCHTLDNNKVNKRAAAQVLSAQSPLYDWLEKLEEKKSLEGGYHLVVPDETPVLPSHGPEIIYLHDWPAEKAAPRTDSFECSPASWLHQQKEQNNDARTSTTPRDPTTHVSDSKKKNDSFQGLYPPFPIDKMSKKQNEMYTIRLFICRVQSVGRQCLLDRTNEPRALKIKPFPLNKK